MIIWYMKIEKMGQCSRKALGVIVVKVWALKLSKPGFQQQLWLYYDSKQIILPLIFCFLIS